ncbi:MAG TPA: hypothetical protein VGU27_04370, partial [Candidatus Eisenbacteria bacterium]|nr:hypothetical protein [Candidatus Eisenbacteria bacterium]
ALDAIVEVQWGKTIAAVNGRKRMLGAFLEESRLVGIANGALVLAMDDLHRAVVDVAEHRVMVQEEMRQAFGQSLALRCVPLAPGEAARRPGGDDVRPLIERAIEVFDGELLDRSGRGGDRGAC